MSNQLVLTCFNHTKELNGVSNYVDECKTILAQFNLKSDQLVVSEDKGSLQINLDDGTVEVHSDYAVFPTENLNPLLANLAFSVARSGNMVAINEGGKYPVVLVNAEQRKHLPEKSWRQPKSSPVAENADKFLSLINERCFVGSASLTGSCNPVSTNPPVEATMKAKQITPIEDRLPYLISAPVCRQDVYMHHFDRSGYMNPKHIGVLSDIFCVLNRELFGNDSQPSMHDDEIRVILPSGTGRILANRACFDLINIDLPTSQLLWSIARIADMAIVTVKPRGCQTILTDPNQVQFLPNGWSRAAELFSVCHSPKDVESVLRRHLELDLPEGQRAIWGPDTPLPLPGTRPELHYVIYLEAQSNRSKISHQQKKLYDYIFSRLHKYKKDGQNIGNLRSIGHQVLIPTGKVFTAYTFSGRRDLWLEMVREFAASEGLLTALIVNFDTLVQDDGATFSISNCREIRIF